MNIDEIVSTIVKNEPTLAGHVHVITKELLHFEILKVMKTAGYVDELTFQGGTCLRLCYSSNRLSEDLDFAGGDKLSLKAFKEMGLELSNQLQDHLNLPVEVKSPPIDNSKTVSRWSIRVTTHEGNRSLPKQRINLEVARIPAYSTSPAAIKSQWSRYIPDGINMPFLIPAESEAEILADKIIALGARSVIKARDIWDLVMLDNRRVEPDFDLVTKKITDYQLTNFSIRLGLRAEELAGYIDSGKFHDEMSRFLFPDMQKAFLESSEFMDYLKSTSTALARSATLYLQEEGDNRLKFKM